MKAIEFKDPASQRVYNNYIARCKRVVKILSEQDQEECLMEINSYIYEFINDHHGDEMTGLLNILDRLGDPEITLKEVVASKKIDQAIKTYNIKHLFQALFLNLRNGVAYVLLAIMTVMLVTFPVLIVMKLIMPAKTGLWVGPYTFFFGIVHNNPAGIHEIAGNFFIPLVIILSILLYFLIITILKAIRKKKP
ncbi:DUF1700 domain-containing protein [Chitinophaga sancti]|uniref:DUF1700 domain-containing protein n=1 Tax=Chitinophaga sancti TaxID=1004 RepID=A0A1K1MXN6_9BACT|nr:hypothetical protein [Chitinophaga sancti]WQD63078.1 hypothetical protein U0033_01630 [Chitinophaga sancti]WQG91297.1 hypothetical protein SR876_07285 [Chitinophaga sancti]SFW27875.1 hypothetical protein SAMN05661012_00983 [Chitinophaga sancti]